MPPYRKKDSGPPVSLDDIRLANLVASTVANDADHAAWSDERFIKWLTEQHGDERSALARGGRRLITRAYCRQFRIQLFEAPPDIVASTPTNSERWVPLIELATLGGIANVDGARGIVVPDGLPATSCVACVVGAAVECFARLVSVGDTLLVTTVRRDDPPSLALWRVNGAVVIAPERADGEFLGTVTGLWPAGTS